MAYASDLCVSTFQDLPAYRYIRKSDKLPVDTRSRSFDKIVCKVRLFNPTGVHTWWIAEYDPDTHNAWGVTDGGQGREVGSFSMDELIAIRGQFGLPIERDLYYRPVTVAQIQAGEG